MLESKHIGKIVLVAVLLASLVTVGLFVGDSFGLYPASLYPAYVKRLFDESRVHTIDISMEDFEGFIDDAGREHYRDATFTIDGDVMRNVGVRVKGNSSRRLTRKYGHRRFSFKVKMDHYVAGQYYHGLDEFSLDASFQDNSYLKTYLVYDLMNHLGVPAPRTSFAWLTVDGEPYGLYLIIEEPNESFIRRHFGDDYGQLYKPDYKTLQAENKDVWLVYHGDDPALYENIFRKARFKPSEADKARLINSLKVLWSKENLETVVNIDLVMRYFAVHNFVVNLDGYLGHTAHNYFLYEKDGVLSMLPWDYNLAFGTYALGMPNPINDARFFINHPINTPGTFEIVSQRPMYHHLMQVKANRDLYHQYLDELVNSYFESGLYRLKLDGMRRLIEPYVRRDPTAFISYDDHVIGADTLLEFCRLRAASVRGQLDGTIPKTTRGQREHPETLIDPGELWIPDMGEIADLKDGPH